MRLKFVVALFLIGISSATERATAESEPWLDSDCHAWVMAVRGATSARPALELLVAEKASGKYKPPDFERFRATAEDLYKRYDMQDEFPTVEDFVRRTIEDNTHPLDYSEQSHYRITITSNRFLVASSNLMERHNEAYRAVAGVKEGRRYNAVAINDRSGEAVRSTWAGGVAEYTDFFDYGCVSGNDLAMLEVVWNIVGDKTSGTLWQALCKNGGELQVGAKGIGVKITNDDLESREVIRIEISTDDGRGAEVYLIDKTDGRMLLLKEARNVEGVQRVKCADFVSVQGSDALYPRTIIAEEFDAVGAPVKTRILAVRSVVALTDDNLRSVDWDLRNGNPSDTVSDQAGSRGQGLNDKP